MLGDMSGGLKPPPMTILRDAERDQREFRGVPMDVDDAASGPPPPLSTAVVSAGPSYEELECVFDRVVELEGTLSNIRNDLDARYDDLEEKMEEFRFAVEEEQEEGGGGGDGGEEKEGVNLLLWIWRRIPMRRMVKSTILGLLRRTVTPGSERTLTSLLRIMILRGRILVNCRGILLNRSSRRVR